MTWTATEVVTILGVVITTVGAIWVAYVSRPKSKDTPSPPVSPAITIIQNNHAGEKSPSKELVLEKSILNQVEGKPIRKQLSPLTHAEMSEHIMRVPPAQRPAIEAHYIGLRVKWLSKLDSVSRPDNNGSVMVHAKLEHGWPVIECHANQADIDCLIHVPENGRFVVEGTLHLLGRSYCILHDCIAFPSLEAGHSDKDSPPGIP